jgi:hypothetical protein
MDDWIEELCTALDVDPSLVDLDALLDVARDAAHQVERRAAPITTYLIGLAAGRTGAPPEAITEMIADVAARARARAH